MRSAAKVFYLAVCALSGLSLAGSSDDSSDVNSHDSCAVSF